MVLYSLEADGKVLTADEMLYRVGLLLGAVCGGMLSCVVFSLFRRST